jgi:hypothetical protein
LLFMPVMHLWTTTAYLTGRFEPHSGHQVMLLLSTFAMMIMGTVVPGAFAGEGLVFAAVFVTARVARPAVISLGLRSHRLYRRVTAPPTARTTRRWCGRESHRRRQPTYRRDGPARRHQAALPWNCYPTRLPPLPVRRTR